MEAIEALIGPVSVPALLLVASAVAFAGFLRGFVGFGAALIITMVLSVVFGPAAAVPIATMSGFPPTMQLLPTAIREADRPFVVPFGLAAFVAAPIGAWFLVTVDAAIMRMLISAFVIAMTVMLYRNWQLTRDPGPSGFAGAGGLAGFVQGAAGVSGPLAVVVAMSRPGTPRNQRANVIGAVTSLNLCGIAPFLYHGLFTRQVIVVSLAMIPLYSLSIWLGARYFSSHGHQFFRRAALVALAVIGVVTLVLAVQDYAASA